MQLNTAWICRVYALEIIINQPGLLVFTRTEKEKTQNDGVYSVGYSLMTGSQRR